MGAFQHSLGTYTLLQRTLHREKQGGYEVWEFEVDEKKYVLYSDIRYLGEVDERVIIVDFYSTEALETISIDPYILTNTSNYSAAKVFGCINELITRIIPPLRKYRYVAFPGGPKWANIHSKVISKYGTPAPKDVTEATIRRLNYDLNIEIDSGYSHCAVGDLITNPDFVAAGLDKKENRQKVDLMPVSANVFVEGFEKYII